MIWHSWLFTRVIGFFFVALVELGLKIDYSVWLIYPIINENFLMSAFSELRTTMAKQEKVFEFRTELKVYFTRPTLFFSFGFFTLTRNLNLTLKKLFIQIGRISS